jgi:hypothetical protein
MGGLCRYDGHAFKLYDNLYLPAESMILEDSRRSLWYDPEGELHRLDVISEKVTSCHIGLGTRTRRIFKDRSINTGSVATILLMRFFWSPSANSLSLPLWAKTTSCHSVSL